MRIAANAGISLMSVVEGHWTLNPIYPDGGGVDCDYFQLSDHIGLKFYKDEDIGFYCYSLQKLLHAHGLAPDCWGFSEKNGKVGFFTDHVDVACDVKKYYDDDYLEDVKELRERVCNVLGIERDESEVYDEKLDEYVIVYEYPHMDMHSGNIGVINDRLVLIDVGFVKTSPKASLSKYGHISY